jgi:hypothetical protein
MKLIKIVSVLVLVLFCANFMGCGGGGANVQSHITTTSLGEELTDLEKAYSAGIINQKEYERAKKGLMKRYK